MSFKRPRTPTGSDSTTSSPTLEHTPKSSRTTTSSSSRPLLCSLPPTCNPPRNQPTHIANTKDLETHYATYHAHVCEFQGCGCVFPDARLLELHQIECHDPIAAIRKERGEKIFACHLSSCARQFSSPKTRRLHLIDTHSYPKEYFFAVTNKGVGGLLKKWGEGVSMLRGEWKEREGDDGEEEDRLSAEESIPAEKVIDANSSFRDTTHTTPQQSKPKPEPTENVEAQMDGLTSSMTSLSLVPPSIRFGRGGKSGGFGNGNISGQVEAQNQSGNPQPVGNANNGNLHTTLGRGRGRGRGGFIHPVANGHHAFPVQGVVGRGGFIVRGLPAGRAGIINLMPGRGARGRGRGGPRGRGRGGNMIG